MSSLLIKFIYLNIKFYRFWEAAYTKILLIWRLKLPACLWLHSWRTYKQGILAHSFFPQNYVIKCLLSTKHWNRGWECSSQQNEGPSMIALHPGLGVSKFLLQNVRRVNVFGFAPRLSFTILNLATVVQEQPQTIHKGMSVSVFQ